MLMNSRKAHLWAYSHTKSEQTIGVGYNMWLSTAQLCARPRSKECRNSTLVANYFTDMERRDSLPNVDEL